jgi:putative ABC transport system permease protein
VRERTSELGVLKAIGFTDGQVLRLVISEALLIATIAGGLGLTIGWWLVGKGDPTKGALPAFLMRGQHIVFGIICIVLLGIATGLVPALQAMRMNPVDALRRE